MRVAVLTSFLKCVAAKKKNEKHSFKISLLPTSSRETAIQPEETMKKRDVKSGNEETRSLLESLFRIPNDYELTEI
jgi:hypothetical protein